MSNKGGITTGINSRNPCVFRIYVHTGMGFRAQVMSSSAGQPSAPGVPQLPVLLKRSTAGSYSRNSQQGSLCTGREEAAAVLEGVL